MASHAPHFGRAEALPLSDALSVIPSLPRALLARLVERALERLDELDGDPDLEDGGDGEPIDEREPDEGDLEPDCPQARERYARERHVERHIAPEVHLLRHEGRTWRVVSL